MLEGDEPTLRLGFRLIDGFREEWAAWRTRGVAAARSPISPALARLPPAAARAGEARRCRRDAQRSGSTAGRRCGSVRGLRGRRRPAAVRRPATSRRARPICRRCGCAEHVVADYQSTGLSLKAHPLRFLRDALAREGVRSCAEATGQRDGAHVAVAGVVLVRQRPGSAAGVVFATIEDETGIANIVIWPAIDRALPARRGGRRAAAGGRPRPALGGRRRARRRRAAGRPLGGAAPAGRGGHGAAAGPRRRGGAPADAAQSAPPADYRARTRCQRRDLATSVSGLLFVIHFET